MKKRYRRLAGFTLLELIVALSIFAVVSVLAYGGLKTVLDARDHAEKQAARLAKLQTGFMLISRDVEQAVSRAVRDPLGTGFYPAMRGRADVSKGSELEFTREGYRNPTGQPRSNMQRVGYGLKERDLVRLTWPVLDRVQASEPKGAVIFNDVQEFEVRYLDAEGAWHNEWATAPEATAGKPNVLLPVAMEITLDIEGWGRISRLFRVPGGNVPRPVANNPQAGAATTGTQNQRNPNNSRQGRQSENIPEENIPQEEDDGRGTNDMNNSAGDESGVIIEE